MSISVTLWYPCRKLCGIKPDVAAVAAVAAEAAKLENVEPQVEETKVKIPEAPKERWVAATSGAPWRRSPFRSVGVEGPTWGGVGGWM